eukprot:jgi/Chrzof1/10076/Cz04g26070.t1
MDKKRPMRPSALRAQTIVTNGGYTSHMGSDSEADEELLNRPPPRASARRTPKIDFTKLETISLMKYRKTYKLGETPTNSAKEDLIPAIQRHFASTVVDEDETLLKFAIALRKNSGNKTIGQLTKKPRNPPTKPKGR